MSLFEDLGTEPERYHLASDDYEQLSEALWRASPERSLDGDPYQPYRSRYRQRQASSSTDLSAGTTGDSWQSHTDLGAPPGSFPSVDFIPYEPGVMCSYCGVNPAECTVNGSTLCLEDAENHWGIDVSHAAGTPGVPGKAPQMPQEPPEDEQGPEGALEPHEAATPYQGGFNFKFYKSSPRGFSHHVLKALTKDHPDHPDGRIGGVIMWHHKDGLIQGLKVNPEFRRQGLATELLHRAREVSSTADDVVPPRHHSDRSEEGEAWARSLGEDLPERREGQPYQAALHEAMAQYQGDHEFVFTKANPREMGGSQYHRLVAWPKGQAQPPGEISGASGYIAWHHQTGKLNYINTRSEEQRQGLATELWRRASEMAKTTRGIVPPRHSNDRTNPGEAWARSLNQRLPKRVDPSASSPFGHEAAWHPSDADEDNLYNLGGSHHTSIGRWHNHHLAAVGDAEWHQRWAENSPAVKNPDWIMQGAHDYRNKAGLAEDHTDYSKVMADKDRHSRIAAAYEQLPSRDEAARPAYERLRDEVNHQYHHLTQNMGVKMEVTDTDPYKDHQELVNDVVNNKRMKVLSTKATGPHPIFSNEENDRFRFVHDFFGHAATGRGFDRHGEEAAWRHHASMFSPEARGALTTETRGQNASLINTGKFPEQKVGFLPQEFHNEDALHSLRTGAWRDVMDKAKRMRTENAVHLLEVPTPGSPYVFAEVKGDTALHHCFVAVKGGEQGQWSCSCTWGDYGPNGPLAEDRASGSPYKKTPCSHILATRWELQSRSMFGRNPYTGALHQIEREGAMETDILQDWFSGRFLVEARETPQYPPTRLAPHPNIEGTPLPTQGRPGTYKRNDRATNFEDLHPDHQKVVREHFANNFKDEDGNGLTHERMVQNVKDMYHDAAQSDKMEGKYHYLDHGSKWYNTAHKQIKQWAKTYGVKPLHMAAAAAALSPSTDWDSNLTMTHYFARHLGKNREAGHEKLDLDPSKFDDKQMAAWHKVPELDKKGKPPRGNPERLTHAQIADRHGLTNGRAFDDMNDREAAHALHLQKKYTHNDLKKSFGGDMVEHPTYGSSWQSADNAEKAVGMMRGTSHVDKTLSGSKVRSFFNNLWHPGKTDDVTIDSHAASMIVGAKMGASSEHLKKAMELQGAGKETLPERTSMEEEHNVNGGYAYMASALRKAHADLVASGHMKKNSTPADLQAITWKRWRDRNPGGGAIPKEEKVPSLYTPKDIHPILSHLDDNEDHHDRFHDDDWASSLDNEPGYDESEHDENDPDELLDPYGGPDEPDPELNTEPEEPEDNSGNGYDELPSHDDYSDMLTDRRKEGSMYNWTAMLRQARRERLAAVQASSPPAPVVPVQYLSQVPHHLAQGMDEFGFEPHQAIAAPSEQWQTEHSPGAKNPASTAPDGFDAPLDPADHRGPFADERLLEPGPVITRPMSGMGLGWGSNEVVSSLGGGGGGGSFYGATMHIQAGTGYQTAQYIQAPLDPQAQLNPEPPYPMVQAPSSQPISLPPVPEEPSEGSQALASYQDGLEWLRPPGGGSGGPGGASPGMSREALVAQHQADKAQLAAGAEAFLRSGSVPVPGMEVNMNTIFDMPAGSLSGMSHDARSRDFTPAEQDEMVREGELEGAKASNLHMLKLEGSMYEELERQITADDQSEASANALWW